MSERKSKLFLLGIICLALLLRIGMLSQRFDSLSDDRDAYLGIANAIVAGDGFSVPGTNQPTAFRPPLFPVLVAVCLKLGGLNILGFVQVILSVGIVYLTIQLGQRLGNEKAGLIAGFFVALDPLLNWYVSFPMTETFFTFLVMLLMNAIYKDATENAFRFSKSKQIQVGILFGLCVLCRPSILAFPILLAAWKIVSLFWSSKTNDQIQPASRSRKMNVAMILAAIVVLAPWGIRNYSQIGKFTVTTTHGGYTVLLGNNPVFYEQVVQAPWGTTWGDLPNDDPNSQMTWVTELHRQAKSEGIEGEVALDSWMYQRAIQNIQNAPLSFTKSCILRVARFWNFSPQGPQRANIPSFAIWGIALFYAFQFVLLLGFLISLRKKPSLRRLLTPLIILIITFTIVHSIYWSNMRMRAPLIPAIALLAAHAMKPNEKCQPVSQ